MWSVKPFLHSVFLLRFFLLVSLQSGNRRGLFWPPQNALPKSLREIFLNGRDRLKVFVCLTAL